MKAGWETTGGSDSTIGLCRGTKPLDRRRQQEARLSIMEDMRGVGDFLKLTACQPGQVLGAGNLCADPAFRSQDSEPVDRCANFSLMYPSDGEMNPSFDRYSSFF